MKNVVKKEIKKLDRKVRDGIIKNHPRFSTRIDQYLKWTPALSVFALDAAGLKTKNDLRGQLKIIGVAEAFMAAIVKPLKSSTKKVRPNASLNLKSFPSNHTATAFLGAEILHQELKEKYPLASYSGYAIALTTGVLRMYKNKHWLSDVAAGAVIGILSAKFAYWISSKKKQE